MRAATSTAKQFHRSAAEQIEYWADLGRQLADVIDPNSLAAIAAGVARVQIDPIVSNPVNPDDVFKQIETERDNGTLPDTVTTSTLSYQASTQYPGYLEQIGPTGQITIGHFRHGQFVEEQPIQYNAID